VHEAPASKVTVPAPLDLACKATVPAVAPLTIPKSSVMGISAAVVTMAVLPNPTAKVAPVVEFE